MALVKKIEHVTMERNNVHDPVRCTFCIFEDETGRKHLQLDTYGSDQRKLRNKKSQSLQFGPEAIKQLRVLIDEL